MATIRSIGKAPKGPHEVEQRFRELRLQLPPSVFDATTAPVDATDNYTKGWKVGSKWFDTTNHVIYECSFPGTPSSPTAVWQQMVGTNPTAGAGGTVAGSEPLEATDYIGVNNVSLGLNVRATISEIITASGVPQVAFATVDCSTGDDLVADTATDTLKLTGGTGITVTGVAANDEATIATTAYLPGGTDVAVTDGGTGVSTLTDGGVLVGNGTGVVQVTAVGTAGHVLTSNGAGNDPTFQAAAAGYSDEQAQDAVGAMVDTTLVYTDGTPLLSRAALTGDATASAGSNALTLATVNADVGSFTNASITVNAKGLVTAASSGSGGTPTVITVANEATDTTCFLLFGTAATGDLGPKTNANLAFNSNTGALALAAVTVTTINKITLTAPATSSRLDILDGTTITGPPSTSTLATLGLAETLTGVKTFGTTTKLQFRDTGLYINSSVDGQLDIVADTLLQLGATGSLELNDAVNVIVGTTTGTKFGTSTSQKIGFFNATPVVQPSAITQTFSTADATHAARTATALTDNSAGTANTTIQAMANPTDTPATADALRDDIVTNLLPAIRNNFADLAASNNAIIVDLADTAALLNSVVDKLQALGLVG